MDGDAPHGSQCNFDIEIRKTLTSADGLPARERLAPDAITQDGVTLARSHFTENFGTSRNSTLQ